MGWSGFHGRPVADGGVRIAGTYKGYTRYEPVPPSESALHRARTASAPSDAGRRQPDGGEMPLGAMRSISTFNDVMNTRLSQGERPRGAHANATLGLCVPIPNAYWAPGGRVLAGEYPGHPDPGKAREKLALFLDANVVSFIDLTTPADGLAPYDALLRAHPAANGDVHYRRMSIRDLDVPSPAEMTEILDHLDAEIAAHRTAYVHCWGGIGRTGTVIGCWLVRHGASGEEALRCVRELFATMDKAPLRPQGSPETREQREFVREWADLDPRRSTGRPRSNLVRLRDRFRGALLGGGIGDALGAPVEFLPLAAIQARYGAGGIQELDEHCGRLGSITDDTQMTLFTAEGILRGTARQVTHWAMSDAIWNGVHAHQPECMHYAYLRWLRTQNMRRSSELQDLLSSGWLVGASALHARRAPGNTCLSALQDDRPRSIEAPLNDSKGCGGVMRVAPIGLVPTEDAFGFGAEAAAITHGHPTGYLSAGALACVIDLMVSGASLEDAVAGAVERLKSERRGDESTAALERAVALWRTGSGPDASVVESLGRGWTAEEALAIATYCALAAEGDFERGIRLAVNHSGDSDSTGAICGNLLGAALGVGAIPERWIGELELRREIEAIADDLLIGFADSRQWLERFPPN